MLERCPVLAWAASGAMALTGYPDGEPLMSPAPAFALLGRVTDQLAEATRATGNPVRADPAVLLTARAALAGFTRRGRTSLGGAARLLRTADGWCAVTLSRTDDIAAVPAILAGLGIAGPEPTGTEQAWNAIEAAAFTRPAEALATAAQSLGVPAAALPQSTPTPGSGPWPPWQVTRISAPSPGGRLAGAVIADLSSMWAGPLCARLLGLAGALVIKVETPDRPDGARTGDRRFFDWLHAGHQSLLADFRTQSGRAALAALLATADVVIEASRPRALANLGLAPETVPHKDGQVWLSITGYGRAEPGQVAFGDDAAVAGGLVGWAGVTGQADGEQADGEPVFCADAIADPLTGVCGALAVARSLAEGGGQLIDISMRSVAASFAAAPPLDHGPHYLRPDETVSCPQLKRDHAVLLPRSPELAGRSAQLGADTEAVLAWLATC